jgi:hypothetical protein
MRYLFMAVGVVLSIAVAESNAGEWRFSVGPNYRGGMKVESSGSSYAQGLPRTAPQCGYNPGPPQLPCIPTTFADGYVYSDGMAPWSTTWFWGYDNASQYNPANDTLTFHSDWYREGGSGYRLTPSVIMDRAADFSDRFEGYGLEFSGGYTLKAEKSFQVDFCVGLSTIWDAHANMGGETFVENVSEITYYDYTTGSSTYTYDVSGVTVPGAPYQGSAGGPEIPYIASSSSGTSTAHHEITGSREWTNRNMIDMSVDTDIYSLWLGPQVRVNAGSIVSLHLTPRISLNYVDVEVDRRESFVRDYKGGESVPLQSWRDRGQESELIFGAGITAGADFELENGLFAGIRGGYEWLSDEVDVDVGPGAVEVDASGYTATLSVGIKFGG